MGYCKKIRDCMTSLEMLGTVSGEFDSLNTGAFIGTFVSAY